MSTNINSIEILSSEGFCISRPAWQEMRNTQDFPDVSFLEESWPKRCCDEIRGMLFVNRFSWSGEASGFLFDKLKEFLSRFHGRVDLVLTWEGGNGASGLRLLNGKVTEHKVVQALGDEG